MVTGKNKMAVITWAFFMLLCGGFAYGQDTATLPVFTKYPFIHNERNEIVNANALDTLFEKLYKQKTKNNQRINMLHIGDSHIQADMLTGIIRSRMQQEFGNAGRGLVVPLRVSGSNEPYNYKISSNVKWYGRRCVYITDTLDYGIGGFIARTTDDSAQLNIRTFDYPPLNYAFKKVTLFYQHDSSFAFALYDTSGNRLAAFGNDSVAAFLNYATVKLPAATNYVVLKAERQDSTQTHATVYGFELENDSSGVQYHVIGVNGAEAFQLVAAKQLTTQAALLLPDVIIISLGTNEAQRRPFDKALTEARLDTLVKLLQLYNPGTPIILTSPPDSYYRRKYYNEAVSSYHALMVDYAKKNNLAVWDLFSVTGGYKSCYQWKKYGLMRKDGVHFSRAGYELQGNLFYEAIVKAYNEYAGHRLP